MRRLPLYLDVSPRMAFPAPPVPFIGLIGIQDKAQDLCKGAPNAEARRLDIEREGDIPLIEEGSPLEIRRYVAPFDSQCSCEGVFCGHLDASVPAARQARRPRPA